MSTLTRRELLQLTGIAAAAAVIPGRAQSQALTFPKGAIIRTLFRDYAPEELAGGATLFHEHLSLGPDFADRFRAASAAVLAAQGLPSRGAVGPPQMQGPDPMRDVELMAEELRVARRDGVVCLVDAGLEGAGMDLAFIRAAARLLHASGALWLVANRHLPYEETLQAWFLQVEEMPGTGAFKVFRASRPLTTPRDIARGKPQSRARRGH